jgi:hypothetical protein
MSRRTTSRSVTFRRPFILSGFEAVQAAGTYVIDVEDEAIESLSFLASRRTSTQMRISALGATEHRTIDPAELDKALLRDAAQPEGGAVSPMEESLKREKADKVRARLATRG